MNDKQKIGTELLYELYKDALSNLKSGESLSISYNHKDRFFDLNYLFHLIYSNHAGYNIGMNVNADKINEIVIVNGEYKLW